MYNNKRSVMGKWKRILIAAALTASMILALPVWNVGRAQATEADEPENTPTDTPNAGNPQTDGKLNLSGDKTLNVKRASKNDAHQGDIEVVLYKVATAKKIEGYDAYTLELDTPYTALQDDLDAALNQGEQTTTGANALYSELAQKAAKIALGVSKTEDGKLTASPQKSDIKPITISGNATEKFTVNSGMYLVIAYGKDLAQTPDRYVGETSVTTTAEDGTEVTDTQLVTMAYSDGYVYRYLPELISLPSRGNAPIGSFSTAGTEPWSNTVNIELKSEVASEMASLQINKTFSGVPENDRAALSGKEGCVYQIEAVFNGQTVYSNVVAVNYQGAATAGSELLENVIPVGAEVTVTEVYDGAAFTVTANGGTVTIPTAASGTNTVSFVNNYNNTNTGGGIVTNKFTPVQDRNGAVTYNWTNDDPAGQE